MTLSLLKDNNIYRIIKYYREKVENNYNNKYNILVYNLAI